MLWSQSVYISTFMEKIDHVFTISIDLSPCFFLLAKQVTCKNCYYSIISKNMLLTILFYTTSGS